MEETKSNLYEKIYRRAWKSFERYWLNEGVDCKVTIESGSVQNDYYVRTYVRMQGNLYLLVHQVSLPKEIAPRAIWATAVEDLLKAGAAKMYENTIQLKHDLAMSIYQESLASYPLKPQDCLDPEKNPYLKKLNDGK